MKICIDGFSISRLIGTGLYSYTKELISNLLKIYPQPCYSILYDEIFNEDIFKSTSKTTYIDLSRKTEDFSKLYQYIINNKINLYHCPNNGFRCITHAEMPVNFRQIITVHDILAMSNPHLTDDKYRARYSKMVPVALKCADSIIATSEYLKKEIMHYFETPSDKIEVIYPGISEIFTKLSPIACKSVLSNKYNINQDFIFYAGSIHPRKNLKLLISAFKQVASYDDRLVLVIAGNLDGKRYSYYQELMTLVGNLNIREKVIFVGQVDYADMPFFYNAAQCTLNLSSDEGFPLASVESLACGTPTICSNIPVFKETVHDFGAILVNIENEQEIVNYLVQLLFNNYYSKVITKPSVLVQKYSSLEMAKKTIRIYEKNL